MSGATLAACLKNAKGPARVGVSVHIVCEVANALHAMHSRTDPATGRPFVHGNVGPESIFVRHDGGVELLQPSEAARSEALRARPGHLAPEQVSAGDVDRRADVFSLGIVLWELLTAARLFERESASATRVAVVDDPIPDVRDVNPQVPPTLGQVLGAALERKREGRFDTVDAFGKALMGAAASSGVVVATKADLARWVAERVPAKVASPSLPSDVPDLDVPGASRAHRSLPRMEAVKVPSASGIPAFDVNAMAAAALAPSVRPPAASVPPSTSGRSSVPSSPVLSGRPSAPASASASASASGRPSSGGIGGVGGAGVAGGGREIAFDTEGDDDFDMEIERNVASTSIPVASSPRMSAAPRASGGHRVAGTGLELAQPSRMAREESARRHEPTEPGTGLKLLGTFLSLAVAGGVAFGLFHQLHRAGGRDLTRALPHAFDGTSATESGAVALVTLVIAIVLGFIGLRLKPHAWGIVAAGGAMLLLALAMVTVTLGSTGEATLPPDGVLLVPYLFPAATIFFALGVLRRAARTFARASGARRATFVLVAAFAGALAFIAVETSRLAH